MAGEFRRKTENLNKMGNDEEYSGLEAVALCSGAFDYRGILEHITDGVVILREGEVVFANNTFYELSRIDPNIKGIQFIDLISPDDRIEVCSYISKKKCEGVPSILGTLTDITERRKIRSELESLKIQFESILQSMTDVIVSFSPRDYSILTINPAAESLYGVPLREFISGRKHTMRFVHPADKDEVNKFYNQIIDFGFAEAEYRIITPKGIVKLVRDEGHVIYQEKGIMKRVDHIISDITEERKMLNELKESESKYRSFIESTSDMTYVVRPDGKYIDLNNAGLRQLGYSSKQEALQSNLKHHYVDISERATLLGIIHEKGYVTEHKVTLKNTGGKHFQIAITAHAKYDEQGDMPHYYVIAHNITEALQDQSNRVLRKVAGGICHYSNTHLMHIEMANSSVKDDLSELEKKLGELGIIGRENPEIYNLLNEIEDDNEHIRKAYENIKKVTLGLSKAFLYKEEKYVQDTICAILEEICEKKKAKD